LETIQNYVYQFGDFRDLAQFLQLGRWRA